MKIIGFDLETTGLELSAGHRICEIAIVLQQPGKSPMSMVQRFNPQRPIDPKAQEVHGISFEDLADKPVFSTAAERISKVMNSVDILIAHNGKSFDLPFLNNELRLAGQPEVTTPLIDTMEDGRWATFFGKNPSLEELCFACGVPYDRAKAHAALYDVHVMLEAFSVGHAKGFYKLPEPKEIAA
jgi:DNA polymerase-3 subunit epsilon